MSEQTEALRKLSADTVSAVKDLVDSNARELEAVDAKFAASNADVQDELARQKTFNEGQTQELANLTKMVEDTMKLRKAEDAVRSTLNLTGRQVCSRSAFVRNDHGQVNQRAEENPDLLRVLSVYNPNDQYVELRRAHDAAYALQNMHVKNPHNIDIANAADAGFARFVDEVKHAGLPVRGLDTTEQSNWIMTGMSSEVVGAFHVAQQLAGNFMEFQHPARMGSFDWPAIVDGTENVYLAAEMTGDLTGGQVPHTSSTTGSYKATFAPKVAIFRQNMSYEVNEDSVFALMPGIAQHATQLLSRSLESALINGDETGSQDNSYRFAYDAAWRGLRYMGINDCTDSSYDNGGIAFDDTAIFAAMARMDKWAVNPSDVIICPSVNAYLKMVGFSRLRTLDQYGTGATLFTGELASFAGWRVVPSGEFPFFNADGVVDSTAADNTTTAVLIVNKVPFKISNKRSITLETQSFARFQATDMVWTYRKDFKPVFDPSGDTFVSYMFDITK